MLFLLWVVFSFAAAVFAVKRGRSFFAWLVVSFVASPAIAFLFIAILPSRVMIIDGEVASAETHLRCPDCKSLIRADSSTCKHCGAKLVPQ